VKEKPQMFCGYLISSQVTENWQNIFWRKTETKPEYLPTTASNL